MSGKSNRTNMLIIQFCRAHETMEGRERLAEAIRIFRATSGLGNGIH